MEKKVIVWVGAFMKDSEGRFLIVKRSKGSSWGGGQWQLPGGKLEWGEHPEETLAREIGEETGCKVSSSELVSIGTTNIVAKGIDHHAVQLFYTTELNGDVRISDEHDDYKMVSSDEALNLDLIEGLPEIIKKNMV